MRNSGMLPNVALIKAPIVPFVCSAICSVTSDILSAHATSDKPAKQKHIDSPSNLLFCPTTAMGPKRKSQVTFELNITLTEITTSSHTIDLGKKISSDFP
mmetsp:Transcript_9485/g.13445  ORF Transcript_9485/g.13445 Transcript_9485/m.13445 type:complete len:100 (+) Transcript_9485:1484-1783(+)